MFTLNIEDSSFLSKCFIEHYIEKNNHTKYCSSLSHMFFIKILDEVLNNKTDWSISTQTIFHMKKNGVFWIKNFLKNLEFKVFFDEKTKNFIEQQKLQQSSKQNPDQNSILFSWLSQTDNFEKQKNSLYKKLVILNDENCSFPQLQKKNLKEKNQFLCKNSKELFIDKLSNFFSGITVIPDIHGEEEKFYKAVKWAMENNSFIIFLGDIFSQKNNNEFLSKENIGILNLLFEIIKNNQGIFILGNHDIRMQKILYSYHNSKMVCPSSLKKDYKIAETEMKKIIFMFKYYYCFANAISHCWFKDENQKFYFSHALFNQKILETDNYYERRKLENEFIFGNYIFIDNKFIDDISWIKNIEKDSTCFVGHTVTNFNMPNTLYNENGGKICFLDLGCGKKGNLCVADLVFYKESQNNKIKTKLRNYKII